MVVAAYGLILPPELLNAPSYGCINVHASLLPRWRGAAPIERAIEARDEQTGVTIMQMDAGCDTGAILRQEPFTLGPHATLGSVTDSLAELGANVLVKTLNQLPDGLVPTVQIEANATYAHKVRKEHAALNWSASAEELDAIVRAFNPRPVAHSWIQSYSCDLDYVRVWKAAAVSEADVVEMSGHAGRIVRAADDGIDVQTGLGLLRLQELQPHNAQRATRNAQRAARSARVAACGEKKPPSQTAGGRPLAMHSSMNPSRARSSAIRACNACISASICSASGVRLALPTAGAVSFRTWGSKLVSS